MFLFLVDFYPKQHSIDSGPLKRLRRFHLLQLHLKYLNWHHGAVFASLGFWGTLDDRDIWERQFVGFMDIYTDGDRLVFIWVYVLLWRWCWVTPTHVQACSWSKQRNASVFEATSCISTHGFRCLWCSSCHGYFGCEVGISLCFYESHQLLHCLTSLLLRFNSVFLDGGPAVWIHTSTQFLRSA